MNWISIKDKLPTVGVIVEVKKEVDGKIEWESTGYLYKPGSWSLKGVHYSQTEPTHWREIDTIG